MKIPVVRLWPVISIVLCSCAAQAPSPPPVVLAPAHCPAPLPLCDNSGRNQYKEKGGLHEP